MERILQMKEQVEAKGLKVMGIESVNIHDAIKVGTPDRENTLLIILPHWNVWERQIFM